MCDNSLFVDFNDFLNARAVRIHIVSARKCRAKNTVA